MPIVVVVVVVVIAHQGEREREREREREHTRIWQMLESQHVADDVVDETLFDKVDLVVELVRIAFLHKCQIGQRHSTTIVCCF
jgi:hypothetical protein